MIQLRSEVNKSEIMREVKKQAVKIYENSYQPDLQALAFIQGAEMIFDLLRLPDVVVPKGTLCKFKDCSEPTGEKDFDNNYCTYHYDQIN